MPYPLAMKTSSLHPSLAPNLSISNPSSSGNTMMDALRSGAIHFPLCHRSPMNESWAMDASCRMIRPSVEAMTWRRYLSGRGFRWACPLLTLAMFTRMTGRHARISSSSPTRLVDRRSGLSFCKVGSSTALVAVAEGVETAGVGIAGVETEGAGTAGATDVDEEACSVAGVGG